MSKGRILDVPATLHNYETRISKIHPNEFKELEGHFLSTFNCYSNITKDLENSNRLCNHAVVLMRVAKKNKINVLGVTSERKKSGTYCVQLPKPYNRNETPVMYVGKYNYFTKHESSKWRLVPADKKYITLNNLTHSE